MRLPWPFRRNQRAPVATATGPAAWRELEPLPSTLGEAPLIAPTPPFAADLAGAQPLPPVLDQLGHSRGLTAPAGLAGGIARPVAEPAASAPPPLQRRRRVSGEQIEVPADAAEAAAIDLPPVMPLRPPVVATAAAHASFVDVAPEEVLRLAHPHGLIGPAQPKGASAATPAIDDSASPRSEPGPQRQPETDRTAPSARLTQLRRDGGERLTLGQARRLGLGLGAPISTTGPARAGANDVPPASLPLPQRAAASPEAVEAVHKRAGEGESAAHDASIQPARRPEEIHVAPADPRLEAADAGRGDGTGGDAPVGPVRRHGRSPRAAHAGAATAEAKSTIEPLLGARSLRTVVRRAPINVTSPIDAEAPATPVGVLPIDGAPSPLDDQYVRVHRGPEAARMAAALDARAFTHQGEVYLPEAHGPLGAPPARALLAHELTHVAQQRAFGTGLPGEDTASGQRLEAQARAAETGGRLPLATRPEPPAPPAVTSPITRAGLGAPLDHSPADGRPAGQPPHSTDAVAESDTLGLSAVALPHAQRATEDAAGPTAAGPVGVGPVKRSEEELEELARQLYGKIGLRLRNDLLTERERVGLGVDL